MYLPDAFHLETGESLKKLIAENPFGQLVVNSDPLPMIAEAPLLFEISHDGSVILRCHLARANPLWKKLHENPAVLVRFAGPDTYVSPDWYETPLLVPTWNYASVYITGSARILDAGETRTVLEDLSAVHENRLLPKPPWTLDKLSEKAINAQLRGIVGIEISVETIDGKFKLSQNRADGDRTGVKAALRNLGNPKQLAIADLMDEAETGKEAMK